MFKIDEYLADLTEACIYRFEERFLYLGLQGSYLRGENHDHSDIDVMIIIDDLDVHDMDEYRNALVEIGNFDKSCGFICGKEEIVCWNPLEVCQLLYTTKDYYGKLEEFVPNYSKIDEINYVKVSLGNIYHEICHRYIHSGREKNVLKLPVTCKSFFFLIQNLYYLESGDFVLTKHDLKECVCMEDRQILEFIEILPHIEYEFDSTFDYIFKWCKKAFIRIENIYKGEMIK